MVTEMLHPDQVRDMVSKIGSKICTITFVKSDGSLRVANGLFKPASHIVGSEKGQMQSELMKSRGQIPFYDLKKGAWISFYADKVVEIKG